MIFLAASLSLDAFAVAVAHGLHATKIPFFSKLIVCLISIVYFAISMFIGEGISRFFSPQAASVIGIVLMCGICLWMLLQVLLGSKKDQAQEPPKTLFEFSLKTIGLTVKIIRNPMLSDIDGSRSISPTEAIFLGTALSVDSISTGIGYSLIGSVSIFAPLYVGMCQLLFLCVGEWLGKKAAGIHSLNTDYLQFVSIGVMLLLILVRIWG